MQVVVQDKWYNVQARGIRQSEAHGGEGIHCPTAAIMLGHGDGVESQILDAAQLRRPPRGVIAGPGAAAEQGHRREEAERSGSHGNTPFRLIAPRAWFAETEMPRHERWRCDPDATTAPAE